MASNEVIECTSEEGITIGLIDSMLASANVLVSRDLGHPMVIEALEDLRSSRNIQVLIASHPLTERPHRCLAPSTRKRKRWRD